MKLHQLRDLMAVVEKGGIRAAASHLGSSQPAVSRSLRELEREVGAPLLERHSRGAALTAIGEAFARRAGAAYQELQRAQDEVRQLQGSFEGDVVACLSTLSHLLLLPRVLASFRKQYPKMRLRIIEGVYPVIERRLLEGSVDFYIGPPGADGQVAVGLRVEQIVDNERVVLARKGHPLAQAKSLAELVDADWIATSITADPQAEFADSFRAHGLPSPRLAFCSESLLTWLIAVTTTDMLVISPRRLLESALLEWQVERIHVRETIAAPPLLLCQRAAIPLTPAAEHLADLFKRAALPLGPASSRSVGRT